MLQRLVQVGGVEEGLGGDAPPLEARPSAPGRVPLDDRGSAADHMLALSPVDVIQARPHQVHNAQLHRCLGKYRLDRLWEILQAVHARKEHILHATVAQLSQHDNQNLARRRGEPGKGAWLR